MHYPSMHQRDANALSSCGGQSLVEVSGLFPEVPVGEQGMLAIGRWRVISDIWDMANGRSMQAISALGRLGGWLEGKRKHTGGPDSGPLELAP